MNRNSFFATLCLFALVPTALLSQAKHYATDANLSPSVKTFLKAVNAGPPLETHSPVAARKVLADAQSSVAVDLSGIDVSEKTITSEGLTVKLNIVRPAGVTTTLPVFVY